MSDMKEALFVVEVLRDMGHALDEKLPVITDSKSAADIVQNPGAFLGWPDTPHISHAGWLHWARELALKKVIEVYLAGTEKMMADDKNKVVDRPKMFNCRKFQVNEPDASSTRGLTERPIYGLRGGLSVS
jgi:hypothetical protein